MTGGILSSIEYIAHADAVASGSFHKTSGGVSHCGVLLNISSQSMFIINADVGANIHNPTKKNNKFIFPCDKPRTSIAPPSRTGRLRNP
jgi:hypothetical protein